MEDDRILLLQYDLTENTYTLTQLPVGIDLVFDIAYDTTYERLLLYYRTSYDGKERLAFFTGEEENVPNPFYTVPAKGWIHRDEVRIVGDYVYFCVYYPNNDYHWENGLTLVAHNMTDGKNRTVEKTFDVFSDNENVYCLSFRYDTRDEESVWTRTIKKIIF